MGDEISKGLKQGKFSKKFRSNTDKVFHKPIVMTGNTHSTWGLWYTHKYIYEIRANIVPLANGNMLISHDTDVTGDPYKNLLSILSGRLHRWHILFYTVLISDADNSVFNSHPHRYWIKELPRISIYDSSTNGQPLIAQ